MSTIPPTQLLYLEQSNLEKITARILAIQNDDEQILLRLDQTIFYPRGGGQPHDQGIIESETGRFAVNDVYFADGWVYHAGKFLTGRFDVGQDVNLILDMERRSQHAKLHTAGHLLDVAVLNLGFEMTPTKGYHYPDSPYVEYDGVIPAEIRAETKQKLDAELSRLIDEGFEIQDQLVTADQLPDLCYFVPARLPEGKPIRVVTVYDRLGCPCGGTHIKNINQLGAVTIRKIKVKSGKTRITYQVNSE